MERIKALKAALATHASPEKAKASSRFFKTGIGDYSEGDQFIGVTMPEQRRTAKKFFDLPADDLEELLHSPVHEHRMTALIILVHQFQKGHQEAQKAIYDLYLRNTKSINNWDLVDASAEFIVGPWLENKKNKMQVLQKLARSKSLWERRIAMLATFAYIKKGQPEEALQIALLLLSDEHDLIQKAVGWMLREIGKRCTVEDEELFLKKYYKQMPRTMLRYAIEHFPEDKRKAYLKGEI